MNKNMRKDRTSAFWKKTSLILGTLVLAVQLVNQVTAIAPTVSKLIVSLQGPTITRAKLEALRN